MLETLSAAKKYIVPALEEQCRDILTYHLSEDLVWPAYTWSLKEGGVNIHTTNSSCSVTARSP